MTYALKKKIKKVDLRVDFCADSCILVSVMRDKTTYIHPETGASIYYDPSVEHEDDVSKIWHDFRDCETDRYANLHLDWSPYSRPSKNDVEMWFALGCPDRRTIGDGETVGALTSERLVEALGKQLCIEGY